MFKFPAFQHKFPSVLPAAALLILVGLPVSAIASPADDAVISLEPEMRGRYIGRQMALLEDKRALWNFASLAGAPARWFRAQRDAPGFGFTPSAYWIRFRLRNPLPRARRIYLETAYPLLDEIELYRVTLPEQGRVARRRGGDHLPFNARDIDYRNTVFVLNLGPGKTVEYRMRFRSGSSMNIPLRLWTPRAFVENVDREKTGLGIYFGVTLAMALYNLFIFLFVRDRSYLFYVLYILGAVLFSFALSGMAFQYLWPRSIWWAGNSTAFFIFTGFIGILLFSRSFLNTPRHSPRMDKVLLLLAGLALLGMVLSLFLEYALIIRQATLLAIVSVAILPVAGFHAMRARYRPAYYYMFSWLLLIIGIAAYALKTFGVLPSNTFTNWAMQGGFSLEVILLSLGLADRINTLKKERETARREQLEERVRTAESLSRFVPGQFLNHLNKQSILEVGAGDAVEREMTVLFCDIRGFTALSEGMTADENFAFLNSYLKRICRPIYEHGGFVDKYIGDAVMALFADSPEQGIRAARDMRLVLAEYNTTRVERGFQSLSIGIGLHTGRLMLGTVGAESRLSTTVIGDTVNLAARLESATKHFKVSTIVSASVYRRLADPEQFRLREIDSVKVRGKAHPVVLYELFDADPENIIRGKQAAQEFFQLGLIHYKAGQFQDAKVAFQRCREICPEDGVPEMFMRRCDKLIANPPGSGWSGLARLK